MITNESTNEVSTSINKVNMVRIIKSPRGDTLNWVCEVMPSDGLSNFMANTGNAMLKLRTADETVHPEGYFYVYENNTEPVNEGK